MSFKYFPLPLLAIAVAGMIIFAWWGLSNPQNRSEAPGWKLVAMWGGDGSWFSLENPSGIENIYIMKHDSGYDKNSWLGQYVGDNNYCLDVITGSGQTADIPYETPFDLVPAVKGDANDASLAYASKENVKVELEWTAGFSWHDNSTDMIEYVFENSGYGTTTGYVRINAVFDNNGTGWKLPAGSYAGYTVRLWLGG
ncbi:MAG: hypothetical protein ACK4GQ_00040 [Candidatus Hadarchaeales archaeon]